MRLRRLPQVRNVYSTISRPILIFFFFFFGFGGGRVEGFRSQVVLTSQWHLPVQIDS